MTEDSSTKPDIIDAIDEAILDPEAPAAVIVPNDFADSVTVVTVKPEAKKPAARKPAARKPAPGKEVAKKDDTAPVVEGELPLEKSKAESLDKKISTAVAGLGTAIKGVDDRIEKLTDLVNEAKAGQIHVALGYASWTAYFTERVQTPVVSLTERKNVIGLLHDAGMSQRDIAAQVKVSVGTVNSTVQELNASRPATADKPASKTVDKRGAVRDRAKAGQAGKKAAAQKKKTSTGNVRGPQISERAVLLGEVANILEKNAASKFLSGEITNIRRILKAAEKVLKDFDTLAANNKTAKA